MKIGPSARPPRPHTLGLTLYRRHTRACRFTQPTYHPATPKDHKADTCQCPIVASGYLAHELSRIRHLSFGTSDWAQGFATKSELEKLGRLPEVQPARPSTKPVGEVTVKYAVDQYLESRANGSGKVGPATLEDYTIFLRDRLLPWCAEKRIVYLKELEDVHTVRQFDQSWANLKTNQPLKNRTRRKLIQEFRTFMTYCIDSDWIAKNTARMIGKSTAAAADDHEETDVSEKVGLELHEYEHVLKTLNSYPITLDTRRLRAVVELMRWTGMRISDAAKFSRSELVRNDRNTGWNASFIPKKTRKGKKRCVPPVPDHVAQMLLDLPFISEREGKEFWFRVPDNVRPGQHWYLKITELFSDAQRMHGKFVHHATPHTLRHTAAIQWLNAGVDIRNVSKWLGHATLTTTINAYSHDTLQSKQDREDAARVALEKMQAKIATMKSPVAGGFVSGRR
jgi:integrase/recombinase XerD